jgi:integral membrane protein
MEKTNLLRKFRLIALLEGCSYLSFGITVPLREFLDMPMPNKIVGWIHGVLFIAYSLLLLQLFLKKQWRFNTCLLLFILSFVPFGTFWADKRYLRE